MTLQELDDALHKRGFVCIAGPYCRTKGRWQVKYYPGPLGESHTGLGDTIETALDKAFEAKSE